MAKAAQASKAATKEAQPAPQDPSQGIKNAPVVVAPVGGGVAVYDAAFAEQMKAAAADASSTERPEVSKLSIKSGVLSYLGNKMPDNQIDVIIIAAVHVNTLYIDNYNPNDISAPRCFALGIAKGAELPVMAPHSNVLEPAMHTSCQGCPKAEWKSDPKGGKGKACKEKRRLVLVPAGTDMDIESDDLALLDIPVMSVKNWATYVNKLAASTSMPYYAAVTRVKVVPDERSQFVVTFEAVGLIREQADIMKILKRKEEAERFGMTPFDTYTPKTAQSADKQKF